MTDKTVQLAINTIRTLSMDAVQAAKSGHPGTPMALAPLVYTIWNRAMRFDPQDPIWPNRDRFVLSNGHASMLVWSILHLTGVRAVNSDYERLGNPSVTLDDIRHFRQLDSSSLAGGVFQLSFTNLSGLGFTVLGTTNLGLPLSNWTVLGVPTEAPAGQYQFTDSQTTNSPRRFYRVRSP